VLGATRETVAPRRVKAEFLPPSGFRPGDARKRIGPILRALARAYPGAKTALDYRSPFELLVATILSAQSTDETVNRVTPALFQRYPDAGDLSSGRAADTVGRAGSGALARHQQLQLAEGCGTNLNIGRCDVGQATTAEE